MATEGFAEYKAKNVLKNNGIKVKAGLFNTKRAMGMLKMLDKQKENSRRNDTALWNIL